VTLRVVVVDDEELPRQRVVDLVRREPDLQLVGEAGDGAGALDVIVARRPDLVFLDIQLPELDGFQVVGALGSARLPAIVFVTAYDAYAIRAFEVDAIDYLLKPVTAERFAAAVRRVRTRLAEPPGAASAPDDPVRSLASRVAGERGWPTRFAARRGAKHYFVRVADVEWIDAVGNYVRLHAGGRSHLIRDTMKAVEARLDPARFVRIHRSAIVAVDRIASIEAREQGEYLVTLHGAIRLVASRGYSDRVRRLLR
jgi:two-component system, LytTR family, response regulator